MTKTLAIRIDNRNQTMPAIAATATETVSLKTHINRNDVVQAASAKGVPILEALRLMQAACAKAGDEETLEALCAVKNEILFGDD